MTAAASVAYKDGEMGSRMKRVSDKSRLGSRRMGCPAPVVARACGET